MFAPTDARKFANKYQKTGKASKQDNRVARIERNALFDRIFAVFRQFKYCSMKVMRERVRQPEAYIREALEEIADLSKSGPFAMNWSLKPENLKGLDIAYATENIAPGGPEGDDSDMGDIEDEDEDDDNVKMEDVLWRGGPEANPVLIDENECIHCLRRSCGKGTGCQGKRRYRWFPGIWFGRGRMVALIPHGRRLKQQWTAEMSGLDANELSDPI